MFILVLLFIVVSLLAFTMITTVVFLPEIELMYLS